jgi:hypothetical protein
MFALIGIFYSGHGSCARCRLGFVGGNVPSNLPGWTRVPLIAFAVFAVGPSVLGLILHVLYLAGANPGQFNGPLERPRRLDAVLFDPLVLTVGLWPFLTLYGVTLDSLIQDRSTWRSVRMAVILSVAAMRLPSTFLLVATFQEMMSSAPDAGQGTAFFVFSSWCSCQYRPCLDGLSVAALLGCFTRACRQLSHRTTQTSRTPARNVLASLSKRVAIAL